jgi:Kef-type K+ transport system membrane component KefB
MIFNTLIYLALFYLTANVAGYFLEKIKIPKIYAALFVGVALSSSQFIASIVESGPIKTLSQIGMFSLLFLLGYGLDVKKIMSQGKLIFKITTFVILSEFLAGMTILHFVFHLDLLLAGIIAVSFATVGEVALLPLLKEFKILKTNLGQTIMGVAVLDDTVEILAFVLMITLVSGLRYSDLFSEMLPLISIVLGMIISNILKANEKFENVINVLALWIFGPIFFFTAGTEASLNLLFDNIVTIVLFTIVIKSTKIVSSYLASYKKLGSKKSIVLGVSLGIKFSTSIVLLIILLQDNLITQELFSILIGIKILFKFIVPIILSILLSKWQLDLVDDPKAINSG